MTDHHMMMYFGVEMANATVQTLSRSEIQREDIEKGPLCMPVQSKQTGRSTG
jgi:hypothetical protein